MHAAMPGYQRVRCTSCLYPVACAYAVQVLTFKITKADERMSLLEVRRQYILHVNMSLPVVRPGRRHCSFPCAPLMWQAYTFDFWYEDAGEPSMGLTASQASEGTATSVALVCIAIAGLLAAVLRALLHGKPECCFSGRALQHVTAAGGIAGAARHLRGASPGAVRGASACKTSAYLAAAVCH